MYQDAPTMPFMPRIPFYKSVSTPYGRDLTVFSRDSSGSFPVKVAEDLFITSTYRDTIYKRIISSPLGEKGRYLYSDMGFYLLRLIVERISGKPFDTYLDEIFYRPLGFQHTTFNPYKKFPLNTIMPTENDTEFRRQLVRGYVHDPGAAMLGGISGHAGVFTNAFELGVIMQMLIGQGSYGGKMFFTPSTVRKFTSCQYPGSGNRRGLGFDRPLQYYKPDSPACNQKLRDMNIRTNIHQAVYDLFEKFGVK